MANMANYTHSVALNVDKCKGCTTCIKHCPTEAIRVRRGKAAILKERCIDCGECIRVCPHRAKVAVCDSFERLKEFEYTVALPAPSLYGQFRNLDDVNIVLQGLLDIGFDMVYEVARAAEMLSDYTRSKIMGAPETVYPVISSACPACVRMICQRFPKLIPNISSVIAPVELAAIYSRGEAVKKTGLPPERIGVFFITPCPAKMTDAHNPVGLSRPVIDGAVSMTDVYLRLLPAMKKIKEPAPLCTSGIMGIGWAASGGESASLLGETYIAVDGVKNVIEVLENIEDGKLPEIEFLEVGACTQGCLGGCLALENPFAAKAKLKKLMKFMPVSCNKLPDTDDELVRRKMALQPAPDLKLDDDLKTALEKHSKIAGLADKLPGLDCASCGAPSCQALAEDVVLGYAQESDCVFIQREIMEQGGYLPPPFRQ